jgi:hypothetical protein
VVSNDRDWGHRYAAYAAAHGRSPEDQLAHDRENLPGGTMAGYLLWIRVKWTEWRRASNNCNHFLSDADHADFDAWLRS